MFVKRYFDYDLRYLSAWILFFIVRISYEFLNLTSPQ